MTLELTCLRLNVVIQRLQDFIQEAKNRQRQSLLNQEAYEDAVIRLEDIERVVGEKCDCISAILAFNRDFAANAMKAKADSIKSLVADDLLKIELDFGPVCGSLKKRMSDIYSVGDFEAFKTTAFKSNGRFQTKALSLYRFSEFNDMDPVLASIGVSKWTSTAKIVNQLLRMRFEVDEVKDWLNSAGESQAFFEAAIEVKKLVKRLEEFNKDQHDKLIPVVKQELQRLAISLKRTGKLDSAINIW